MKEIPLNGRCDSKFEAIKQAFATYLADDYEYGAAISVVVNNDPVVDLWGGYKDAERTDPWEEDSLICMMSTGKALGGLCVLKLVEQGKIELDAPIATYWPEFAQAGKEAITVRQILAHTSGVVFLDPVNAPEGSIFDYERIIKAIELQEPNWPPGTQPAYHTFTIGFLNRELVWRVTGKKIADVWEEEFAKPFGFDYALALSEEQQKRCITIYADDDDAFVNTVADRSTPIGRAWMPFPVGQNATPIFNSVEWRTWGVPDIGHGNARALAKVYGALANGGSLNGKQIIAPELLEEAIRCDWDAEDAVIGVPSRHGLGLWLSCEGFPFNNNPRSFFGLGAGGACGFADPDANFAFSYCMNHMGPNLGDSIPFVKQMVDEIMAAL